MTNWPDIYTHGGAHCNTERICVRSRHVSIVHKRGNAVEPFALTINGRATMTRLLHTLARVLGYKVTKL